MTGLYKLAGNKKFLPITHIPDWDENIKKFSYLHDSISHPSVYGLPENWREYMPFFSPTQQFLQDLHRNFFADSMGELAGMIRIYEVTGGDTKFLDFHHVASVLEKIFAKNYSTPPQIFAWAVEMVGWIHPFFDGNRRTIWAFANMWLLSLGYAPFAWYDYREEWEKHIDTSGNNRLECIVAYYIQDENIV